MTEKYEGPPPTLTEMADAIDWARLFSQAYITVNGGDPHLRTISFCRTAHDLLKALDEKLPLCPKCKGSTRLIDYRGTAVRDVDAKGGYSIEFSPNPAQTEQDYDRLEEQLISGEVQPCKYDWPSLGPTWETMPCSCETGKLSLTKAVEIATAVLEAEPRAMNYATNEQWLEELKS